MDVMVVIRCDHLFGGVGEHGLMVVVVNIRIESVKEKQYENIVLEDIPRSKVTFCDHPIGSVLVASMSE